MLALSRKNKEKIIILCPNGETIVIQAVECHTNKVRLGVKAPLNYKILREELLERAKDVS